ncbi:MAG TPA: TlpA disulfide reductase family protein [Bacillota bacterium]
MNRWLGVTLIILVLLLAFGAGFRPSGGTRSAADPGDRVDEADAQAVNPRPEVGYPAPDFALPALGGGTIRLSDYRGNVVFLNFWATWCPPCLAEMPEIAKLKAQNIPDLVIIGLDLVQTEPSTQAVADFMQAYGYDWPVALDVHGDATLAYQAVQIPSSFFIDADGIIRGKYLGPMTLPIMEDFVRRARSGG